MNSRTLLLLISCATLLLPSTAQAISIEVPEVQVQADEEGRYFIRRLNAKRVIEIRRARDLELMWKVVVPKHNALWSEYRLASGGRRLVHIRSNHDISSIDEVCIEVFQQSGERIEYRVNEVMDKLLENDKPSFFLSELEWKSEVIRLNGQILIVHIANGKHACFFLNRKHIRLSDYPSVRDVDWTHRTAVAAVVPPVTFKASTSIKEVVEFLQERCANPRASRIRIDATAIEDEKLGEEVEFDVTNFSMMYILGRIADEADARLVIGRGVITLEPVRKYQKPQK